ncbi:CPBP family glutamic-type intramembrane protease [Luteococcus sp. Sow4_B9]|uniref:CPBP family glutamic-type intramembrane protease n=1 Tax=Luteococcus sp. Sow4_B9 TaxID=3438792 RepID=UPI003F99249C
MSTVATSPRSRLPFWLCVPLAAVLMFGNYVFTFLFAAILQFAAGNDVPAWMGVLTNIAMSLITLATAIWFVHLVARRTIGDSLRDVGWRWSRDSWWLALTGWAAVALCMVATNVFVRLVDVGARHPQMSQDDVPLYLFALGIVAKIGLAIALQGIPEELVWRGWLMRCLADRPLIALAVSAIVFGMLHFWSIGGQEGIGDRVLYCLHAAAFGFLAGALALRLRSLWCAVGVHAGLHLTTLCFELGNVFVDGPAVWITESVLMLIVGVLFLAGWRGRRVEYLR